MNFNTTVSAMKLSTGQFTNRRVLIKSLTLGAAAYYSIPGLFAEELTATTPLTEGPYYPDKMPLDTDNDLLIINDAITPAVGEITHLTGRILSTSGEPIRDAFVEIWQVDSQASYIHTKGHNPKGFDSNFQGYGRFLTDSKGQYYFRTIKPVPYSLGGAFRTPHIHFAVSKNAHRLLTTQLFVKGHAANSRDFIFNNLRDPRQRETVMSEFKPLPDSKIGELAANFDIVLGATLAETEDGKLHGGLGKAERRYLEVQVSYTGSGPVDNSHNVYVVLWDNPNFGAAFPIGLQRASSKSASVQFDDDGQTNPVYVSMIYDPSGKWDAASLPPSGSSLGLYATQPGKPVPVKLEAGKTTKISATFDDSFKMK
jgi:protocatechuate 3,4-dioxygenase beta subunit